MNMLVCCKIVPEEQDIKISSAGDVDISQATTKISQYDLHAIQAAMDLAKDSENSSITAITLNSPKILDSTKIQKDILSRGANKLICVSADNADGMLPAQTAAILAAVAKTQPWDLILLGEGSSDIYAQQTGMLLGEMLDAPVINGVSAISIENGIAQVTRALENEQEQLELQLPCVLSVSTDINIPAIPTMKSILAAGKKPVEKLNAKDFATPKPLSELQSVRAPKQKDRQGKIFENDLEENIAAFAECVRKIL